MLVQRIGFHIKFVRINKLRMWTLNMFNGLKQFQGELLEARLE
jgi:hypothetical protein